eukprot:4076919-Amphidinium_carterae.1
MAFLFAAIALFSFSLPLELYCPGKRHFLWHRLVALQVDGPFELADSNVVVARHLLDWGRQACTMKGLEELGRRIGCSGSWAGVQISAVAEMCQRCQEFSLIRILEWVRLAAGSGH